jgi:hypothetical protein
VFFNTDGKKGRSIMRIRDLAWFAGVVVMLTACGDDDDKPAAQPATVNKQAAASNAQSTIAALSQTVSASGDIGPSSAGLLSSVAQSSQSLLTAQGGATGTRSLASALFLDDGSLHTLTDPAPGCTCTATGCTFTNCSPASGSTASGQYSFTIDGSYSWGGGHIECKDLTYTFNANGVGASVGYSTNLVVTLNCDLTITSTLIKGTLRSAGSSSTNIAGQNTQGAYSSTWDVTTTYNDVTFDTTHRPTGGSLHVQGTTSVNVAGQSQSYAGSADVTFPVN